MNFVVSEELNFMVENLRPLAPTMSRKQLNIVATIIQRFDAAGLYRHKKNPSAIGLHCRTLENQFGRHYRKLLKPFLTRGGSFRFTPQQSDGHTYEWFLIPEALTAVRRGINDARGNSRAIKLIDDSGQIITMSRWKRNNKKIPETLDWVGVDLRRLEALEADCRAWPHGSSDALREYIIDRTDNTPESQADRVQMVLTDVQILLNQCVASGRTQVPMLYEQPGMFPRYFATGRNLQNVSKIITYSALHGTFQYDIDACHPKILKHFCQGLNTPQLDRLVYDRTVFRKLIAREAKISPKQAKVVINILLYGGGKQKSIPEHPDPKLKQLAISKLVGPKAEQRLFDESSTFNALRKELQACFGHVIKLHSRGHKVTNALGETAYTTSKRTKGQRPLPDDAKRLKPAEVMAFILQAIEVQAMLAMARAGSNPILLKHDAVNYRDRQNKVALERAILEATGIELTVTEKELEALEFGPSSYTNFDQ